jgi:hypothetical protein
MIVEGVLYWHVSDPAIKEPSTSIPSTSMVIGVEIGLDKKSADGFEDGPMLGIKLGIGSTLGVKLALTDSQPTTSEAMHT